MIYIVIPVYNHREALNECLSSLYKQTLRPDKIVIVDDGSSDDPSVTVDKWKDKLPISLVKQENQGACVARNNGFEICDVTPGDFVMFSDADVDFRSDALQRFKEKLDASPDASFSYCSFMFGLKKFECGSYSPEKLKKMPFITTTSLIRVEHFPGFDESLKKFQDWDLWLTMLSRGHTGVWVSDVLFKVKPRADGISSWLPSFLYKIPWPILGYTPKEIAKYLAAREIIAAKHDL